MIRKCKNCGEYKSHKAHGLCRNCYMKIYNKQYYQEHRELRKKYMKQWRKENPEWRRQYDKQYYQEHKEEIKQYNQEHKKGRAKYLKEHKDKIAEQQKQYYQEHKEEIIKNHKQWWKNNLDKKKEYKLKRRVNGKIEKGTISKIINENIFKYGIITCEKCGESCEDNYHIDHIIPISRGGNNEYENLQILCANCNMEKHTRIADYRKKSKQIFLK